MTGFIFSILIGLNFVLFPCEGKIILLSEKIMIVPPGSNVTIEWSFDDVIKEGDDRSWSFVSSDGKITEKLARIIDDGDPQILAKTIPGVSINKPATLVLKNVDLLYNGTYSFSLSTDQPFISDVLVHVAVLTNATVNCSSPITVREGSDVTCLCEAKGGNPAASVTWYKNNVQIGDAGDEEQTLSLRNIERTEGGTYKCVEAQSDTLKDEVSIEIIVNCLVQKTTVAMAIENSLSKVESVVVWHIVVSLLSGILVGVLLLYIIQYSRRRCRNSKLESNPEPPTTIKVDSIYQDLDLNRMNKEENYESLRSVNCDSNDPSGKNESDYTDLKLDRVVEDNYQSLTKT